MDNESENGKKAPDVEQLAGETNSAEPDSSAQAGELVERSEPCGLEAVHGRHKYAGGVGLDRWADVWCPGVVAPVVEDLGTYAGMFAQYLQDQRAWIGPAQQPLVFHIRKLCQRLDADPAGSASFASAYLQAVSRLDRQRPGAKQPAGADGDLPGQGSIFDELD